MQEKVHLELDQVVGRARKPVFADQAKLVHLSAVIVEVMRMRPVAPLGVPHVCTQNTKVCGFNVSQGTSVMINIGRLSNDPKLWKDPQAFRPERFLEEEKEMDLKASETRSTIDEFKFIPFGVGRRACAGYPLAKLQVSLAAMQLCHAFRFSFPENAKVDLAGKVALIHSPIPFKVLAIPR